MTTSEKNETLIKQLEWRYATKKFDATKKISKQDWETLEKALILSPSSYGLQPWKFFVVTDQATKEQLVPVSWGQKQIADCSQVVVFAIRKDIDEKYVDKYVSRIAEVRGVTAESLATYKKFMMDDVINGPRSKMVNEWAARQVYIALGNFMTSAAILGIDTCPMEGIQPPEYDKILGLAAKGYAATVVCVAGYRAADDKYATIPKVRFASGDMIEHI